MHTDKDIWVLEKLKETGIPMTATVYNSPMEKRMLLGYEIDNSILKTKDPVEITPIIDEVEVIEVRFYLNNHVRWFYDYAFLSRHTMAEDMNRYIRNFTEDNIVKLARNIIKYKPLKEIRIINTLLKYSQKLKSTFLNTTVI